MHRCDGRLGGVADSLQAHAEVREKASKPTTCGICRWCGVVDEVNFDLLPVVFGNGSRTFCPGCLQRRVFPPGSG